VDAVDAVVAEASAGPDRAADAASAVAAAEAFLGVLVPGDRPTT
jgi:hypothetical protein